MAKREQKQLRQQRSFGTDSSCSAGSPGSCRFHLASTDTTADAAMESPLVFVLAPEAALPGASPTLAALAEAQRLGPRQGFALRLFSTGRHPGWDLSSLPADGGLTGTARRSADGCQRICDALIPDFDPTHHWLGVYQAAPGEPGPDALRCLDRLALNQAINETCWFYPTHDGSYLSWTRSHDLALSPGQIADPPAGLEQAPYARSQLRLLWSLLGDATDLTCVGLTYGGQRIDWPVQLTGTAAEGTWTRFRVDSSATVPLLVEESRTVRHDN